MKPHFDAYLDHGAGTPGGRFMTEKVEVRHSPRATARQAVNGPLASNWEARVDGQWRRIWINGTRRFIRLFGETIEVRIELHSTSAAA